MTDRRRDHRGGHLLWQGGAVNIEWLAAARSAGAGRPQRIRCAAATLQPDPPAGGGQCAFDQPGRNNLIHSAAWRTEQVRRLVVADVAAPEEGHCFANRVTSLNPYLGDLG